MVLGITQKMPFNEIGHFSHFGTIFLNSEAIRKLSAPYIIQTIPVEELSDTNQKKTWNVLSYS